MINICFNEVTWVPFFFMAIGLYSLIRWNVTKKSENPIIKRGSFAFLVGAIGGLFLGIVILLNQILCL